MRYSIFFVVFVASCSVAVKPTPSVQTPQVPEVKVNQDEERIKKEQEEHRKQVEEQRLKELARQEQEARVKAEAVRQAQFAAMEAQLAKEKQQIQAAKDKQQKEEEELTAKFNSFCADRNVFLVLAKQTLVNVEVQIGKAKDLKEEEDRQQTAFNNKDRLTNQQLEQLQNALKAVPINNCLVCPNLVCGKYKPSPINIMDRDMQCPYCRTKLVKKDLNEEKRNILLNQMQKIRDSAAFNAKSRTESKAQAAIDNWNKIKQSVVAMISAVETSTTVNIDQQKKSLTMLVNDLAAKRTELEGYQQRLPRMVVKESVKEPATTEPKKVYTLKDGTKILVATEMRAGDDIIIKTVEGKMVTIKKSEVE